MNPLNEKTRRRHEKLVEGIARGALIAAVADVTKLRKQLLASKRALAAARAKVAAYEAEFHQIGIDPKHVLRGDDEKQPRLTRAARRRRTTATA